jgi:hypothetical protein
MKVILRTRQWTSNASRYLALTVLLLPLVAAHAAGADLAAPDLGKAYQSFRQQYGSLAPNIALSIHTTEKGPRIWTEVFGTVRGKFAVVSQVLARPQGYCEFLPPLFNLKNCVHTHIGKREVLQFYVGSKHYTSMLRTILIESRLERVSERADYVHIRLASVDAGRSKYGYRVDIEIVPFGSVVLARVHTYYNPDRLTRMAVATYLHTVGGNKIGFSRVPVPGSGKPVYVRGMSGVIERNTVRAFMAMQAYLDTASRSLANRYDARLRRWFELTERFRPQLHEMSKREYLSVKMRERLRQLRLQKHVDREQAS